MSYTADGRYKMELSNATMTSSTFRFLDFNTRYTFEVRTRFSKDNSLGLPVHVIKRTGAFTAPVGRLTAKVGYNSVVLYWSAPGTIRPKALKVKMYLILSIFVFFFFWVLVLARCFVSVILPTNFSFVCLFVCLFVVEVGVISTGERINDENNKKTH